MKGRKIETKWKKEKKKKQQHTGSYDNDENKLECYGTLINTSSDAEELIINHVVEEGFVCLFIVRVHAI